MNTLRFCSYSFGCRVNQAEKEEIDRQMIRAGFIYEDKRPNIFIINTCAVTQKAEREARQLIYKIKKENPECQIIITGCVATYWQKNNLYQNLPVNLLVQNTNKKFLINIVKKRLPQQFYGDRSGHQKIGPTTQKELVFDKLIASGRLLIKIQDGCHRFCSFCIVPYLRGLPKSVRIKDIINKINQLEGNIKEIILTAINTEAFGRDTKETFADLIRAVTEQTKVPRISFGSIHPLTINNTFLDLYKKIIPDGRLVNFFHIPIQSGSNRMLSLMKRGYYEEEVAEKVQSIKRLNKNAFISTDIIVGFLEETDQDFEETYHFLKTVPIDKFHIFRFSKRKGTASYFMSQRLKEPSEFVKKIRAKKLQELSDKKLTDFKKSLINYQSPALFLNKRNGGCQEVLLDNQIPVWVKTLENHRGEIKNVKIISFKNGKLFGKIV